MRSLHRARGFTLLFARCNARPRQKVLIEKLLGDLPEKNTEVVYLDHVVSDLLDELRQTVFGNPSAIFIYGFENTMPRAAEAKKIPLVLNLNASRNAFPLFFDCPVVLWLPDYGVRAIMNGAEDFFSVRSGVYSFEADKGIMLQQISRASTSTFEEDDSLLFEERLQRIDHLNELLNEYRHLSVENRDLQVEHRLRDKLAEVYFATARFIEAEKLRRELLMEAKENHDLKETAHQLSGLAAVSYALARYDETIDMLETALRIGEDILGTSHPDFAAWLNNLASVYLSQGRYDKAIEKFETALRISEDTIGKEHADYATRLSNLAMVYAKQGRYDDAFDRLGEALNITKRTVGTEHSSYAARLNNLSNIYQSQGKYDKAIECSEEALRVAAKTIGKNHPNYAIALGNLASIHIRLGRFTEAAAELDDALRIERETIGTAHPEYAAQLGNLGALKEAQGDTKAALDLFEEALRIDESTLSSNHPFVMHDRESVARCRMKLAAGDEHDATNK